jgi:hypothetical protein
MVFWESFYDIALFGWKQVSLSNAGTMYIPEEWDFTHDSNGEVDAVIYGPRTKSTDDYKQDRQALFICYKAADYEKAVQNGTVYGDLNIILDNSVVVSHELENGVSWTKLEFHDDVTGKITAYYLITIHRNQGYRIISTADSVEISKVLKMATSFQQYIYNE